MNYALKIQIGISVLGVAEAWLEEIIILLKNPSLNNYAQLNQREHSRSAIYWGAQVSLYLMLSWGQVRYPYLLVFVLIFNRRVFFEYSLKCFRAGKRIREIEGDQFWDKISRRIFGQHGGWWELLVCITCILLINKFFL